MAMRDYSAAPRTHLACLPGTGTVSAILCYALFAGLVYVGLPPQVALAVQFAVFAIWNYRTTGRASFQHRGYARLPIYALSFVLIYFSNAFLLHAFLKTGLDAYVAQFLALCPIMVLSHVLLSHSLGVQPPEGGDDLF